MDITPQDSNTTQSISDDQELAKALAGVMPDEPEEQTPAVPDMQFEETPAAAPQEEPTAAPAVMPAPSAAPADESTPSQAPARDTPSDTPQALTDIKNTALNELRPLLGHVELPPEEKFDTYLMLLRSTDDPSLIEPAHTAAQGIGDEKRKAEALLEIIKEIDYLSRKDKDTEQK